MTGFGAQVSGQTTNYFNGFEVGLSPGWDAFAMSLQPTRVSSGTNGITSSTGAWHAQVGTGAATNFGGYHSAFPTCGYKTSVDIYLNVSGGWANDTRVDYSSAISNTGGTHRRDFIFHIGFYNDNDGLGAGTNRFIISRSFNAPGWPKNPANPKFMISQTGWYRFEHTFREGAGGVLEVDLKVYQILSTGATPQVGSTFTLSDPTDIIGSTVGGNRYGWILNNAFSTLAIDNSYLWPVSLVTNLNTMNTYCSIQAAVNAASANDVLEVSEGISNERVTINKSLTLQGVGESQCIVYGAGLSGNGKGIAINNGITDVTIKKLTVQNFAGTNGNTDAGIYAIGGNNNLTVENVTLQNNVGGSGFYANGPVDDVTLDSVTSSGHTVGARGIVIWNGLKSNITITNCTVFGNNCCGIELQDGNASGVTMSNNNVYGNGDSGMSAVGLNGSVGSNTIANNTVTNNGRFGMEIKNPDGATTVSGNVVSRNVPIGAEARDIAGIVVMRRGVLAGNVDIPTGVTLTGNTVSGYTQPSTSEGFGIVVEGTFHTVTGNTVTGNDVGIQQQSGHTPLPPADGNQNDIADTYFGRGNAQTTCGNTVSGNNFSSNGVNTRNVGSVGLGLVTNMNTNNTYCTIQSAVTAANPGDVIVVSPGTYNENVTINKSLTLRSSGGKAVTTITGSAGLGTIIIQANDITIGGFGQGFTINGYDSPSPGLEYAAVYIDGARSNVTIRGNEIVADGEAGLLTEFGEAVSNLVVNANVFSGQTFTGAEAGDCGFTNQFSASNVPRQLVVISTGSGVTFTSNQITGTAGSTSNFMGCETTGQGNTLVTIDASNVTIRGNTFAGTTTRFGSHLRVRGTNASISCNTFDNTGLGLACTHIVFNATLTALTGGATPNTLAGVADANTFISEGAYFTGATQIYRSSAQVAALPQTPIAANSTVLANVTNTNTGETFCSIQSAINDANTLNGHTISVAAGTYAENVTVNKSLTLNGANAGIACGSRGTESILAPASGIPFLVTADGVTINGFEITAPASTNAFVCGATSDLTINYNNIHHIGTSVSGSHVHAINYTVPNAPAAEEDVIISDNCFDYINNTGNSGFSASAIGILQSTTTGTLDSLTIERNTIAHVVAKTDDWTLGGRIANGITINAGGGGAYLSTEGEVRNAIIRNNEISNLTGFIATGIGLEGNTKDAVVENNSVATLTGYKVAVRSGGGYDLNALKFENNRYVATCTVENNSFQTNTFMHNMTAGLGYAVANYVPSGLAYTGGGGGTTGEATLSCNWFGTANYNLIVDNPALDGKIFNKDNCITNFLPFLVNGTDNAGATGFQPVPNSCTGCPGGGFVTNANTNVTYCFIQEAIDAATTGDRIKIATGTYTENVDATAKDIEFAPGNSPGCVTIVGNMTLNSGDELEIEIDGTTPCTQHDQFIVSGTVTLGGATLTIPAGMFLVEAGDEIKIIDGSNPIVGQFAQGNFITSGVNTYYIDYAGGDGNDVVLTKCCSGLLDIGLFNHIAPTPVGNKLRVFVKPNNNVINGSYSQGTFTIRTLASNSITFTNLSSPYGYAQIGPKLTSGSYDYFFFSFESVFPVNWNENTEYELLTLGYACTGNATFELISDAFAQSNGGAFYQELGAQESQGTFYQVTATSPASVTITATSNSPVCETMNIDLNSTTSNGTPAYTYTWSGPDSYSNNVADPAPFAASLASAGTYNVTVTDGNGCTANTSTMVVVPASGACVLNVNTTLLYPTITQAIDAAATMNGHTLEVPAGTWAENLIVNKSLTIKGPNALVDPCSGMRVAEAIVVPAASAISTGEIFHVAASNVTITGFTIDGDNTSIASGYTSTNGADIDAAEGITVYETGINNLTVTNNILKNLSYFGVTLYDYPAGVPSSGHLISNNKFQDFGTYDAGSGIAFWGGGVLLYNNQYAAVTNNCMTNLRIGVQTGNFSQANPGMAAYQVIDNNTMSVRRRGIFHNLFYSTASAYTLSNNSITGIMNANETVWDGILLSSLSVPSTSQNNTINGAGITNPSEGYEVWNVKNTSPAAISGGSVSNVATGLFVNNYEGYSSDAGDGAHASVTGLSISPNAAGTGIRVFDSPSSTLHAAVSLAINAGVTATGGTHGLSVENSSASITGGTLNNLVLNSQTGNYIQLKANAGNLDALAVSFDGNTGATATLAQNFAIEDKIVHKIDDGALGYVSVKANHDFVTVNSFIMPATSIASIQRGVDAASNGYTVNVAAGTYTDNVTVNKEVSILGAGQLLTFVQPLSSNPNPCVGASLCPGASNVMLVQANNVSIQELTIDGDNPGLTSGIVAGGADLDARNGIITNHTLGTYNNLLVNNVTVKNIYLRGIYASSGGTFNFSNNTADNVQADPGSIAMFNFGGAGFFTNNTVSNANDGIASNWSKGTVYSGNTVTSSGSGIHTDNNGGSGGVADTIRNNTVTNSTTGGYGIWVFAPYVNVHVKENTVTNVDVGLANAGQFAAVTTVFTQNTVDGMNKPNSRGVYQTTDLFGFGTADVSGLYTNNFIKNNTDGFYVEYQVGKTNTITVNDNSITGNTTGVTLVSGGTLVNNFNCNWWGNDNIDVVDVLVDANVNFVPFLNNGTDNNVAPGFQPVPASCVNPTHWYVNDNALASDVYTLAVGNDLNPGTKRWPFLTIGKAIMTVVSGDTIFVDAGSYNEQSVVPNTKDNLLFKGAGLSTIVDFTGTVSGKPALFDIAGDGVVIDSFQFNTDLSILSSAIIASDITLDNISIRNNKINPYKSLGTYFGSYGNRNAISINYGGPINYRVASGGVNSIVVDNNIVTATVSGAILGDDAGDIAFRSAVSVDEGAGTYTRNTFQSINHDVLVRFNNNGVVVIGGSVANANTFLGGGVQYSDPNPGTGLVTISHNAFDGSVSGSVLRLQNNYTNAPVTVFKNTLTNLRWGISLENFRNVTVDSNVLSPLTGYTNFRLITVNTKSLSSNSASIVQNEINSIFTRNTFNSLSPTTGGTAMAFYNHDSDNANLGAFTVGTAGNPNVFAKDFTWAVYFGDQIGATYPAPVAFPEYDLGAGSNTTMACWTRDINIEKNTFDVGSGAQYPQFMNNAQRMALEAILWHEFDNPCLGELIYFTPVEVFAKVFLQGPYDSSSGLMSDALRAASLVPTSEPYTAINIANAGSFPEVNNYVTETVNPLVFTTTGNNAIVDWVWLELRDKTNSSNVLGTRSALVQRDGDIVDLDGMSAVLFPDNYVDDYYLMVRHRNHLGAMTATPIDFTGAPFTDFTVSTQATFGTTATSARRLVKTNVYGLWAGNTIPKSSGGYQILYNGSGNDRNAILLVVGPATPLNIVSNVYMLEDVNMNGNVQYSGSGNDRVIILNNVGPSTPLNVITQEPNN